MQKMLLLPAGAVLALALVSCGDKPEHPEQHIQKVIEDGFNSQTLFKADKVTVESSSCGENMGLDKKHMFACEASFTVRDIIGTPNRRHDLSTWFMTLTPMNGF